VKTAQIGLKKKGSAKSFRTVTDDTIIHCCVQKASSNRALTLEENTPLETQAQLAHELTLAVQASHLDNVCCARPSLSNFYNRRFKLWEMLPRIVGALVLCGIVSGCTSLTSPTADPNACVGPPDYCIPFFGS